MLNMSLVIEINKVWQNVNIHPFDRLVVLIAIQEFLDVRRISLDHEVTINTDICAGNIRMLCATNLRVAVGTFNFFITSMQFMTERNGLRRRVTYAWPRRNRESKYSNGE